MFSMRTHGVHLYSGKASSVIPDSDFSNSNLATADLSLLTDSGEIEILQKLALWPRMIEGATEHREPHRIAFFLYELASIFHATVEQGYRKQLFNDLSSKMTLKYRQHV